MEVSNLWRMKMKKDPEKILPRIFMLICLGILVYWIWNGVEWLWEWYVSVESSSETTVWQEIWLFCRDNLSIIIMVYGIISLQVAGLAELKFGKTFLAAFILAICLTPPVMMGVYGRKRTVRDQ